MYLQTVLTYFHESLRQSPKSSSAPGVPRVKDRFVWREFVKLAQEGDEEGGRSLRDRLESAQWYARVHLEKLGAGGGRAVYLLNSRHVLKVAFDAGGIEQNRQELQLSGAAAEGIPLARVRQHDQSDGIWLVSDLVRPVRDEYEFELLSGYDLDFFEEALEELLDDDKRGKTPSKGSHDRFLWGAFQAVKEGGLAMLDVIHIDHWGVTPDRRLVLLDYGYTQEMYDSLPDFLKRELKGLRRP